jgi:hypothetical protein
MGCSFRLARNKQYRQNKKQNKFDPSYFHSSVAKNRGSINYQAAS